MVKVDQINELLGFAKIAMVVGYAVVGGLWEATLPTDPASHLRVCLLCAPFAVCILSGSLGGCLLHCSLG